jgi:NitT/TauT family transport system substrate-binding protein
VNSGDIDFAMQTAAATVSRADVTSAFVHVAGIHVGCFALFADASIRSVSDLKGKRVTAFGIDGQIFTAAMAAYIGLDPNRDFTLVTSVSGDAMQAFVDGKIDAYMAGPPETQQLRKMGVGHVVVNMHSDRPWSQQFCCMLIGNGAFVQNNPVATKHSIRAILKATDLCAQDPATAAQRLLDRKDIADYGAALEMLSRDASYDRWREYDAEDTIRFYALLLHQVGMVKTNPNALVAQSSDWRFFNELKKELKE